MQKKIYILVLLILLAGGAYFLFGSVSGEESSTSAGSYSETEPGFEAEPDLLYQSDIMVGLPGKYTLSELNSWERTPGPPKVGIQVGHWQNSDMPDELKNLERNTGASWNGMSESEVVLRISELVVKKLIEGGVEAELLPATVPPGYIADVFVAVHADGNANTGINGFKLAAPRRDYAGTSQALVDIMYGTYEASTGLRLDPSVTRRMTAYYAFNWPRYEYAIHPFTPAIIVETGFLTSPVDRAIIVSEPERSAEGIANGVLEFLNDDSIERLPQPTAFKRPQLPLQGEVACAPLREERLGNADRYDCLPSMMDSSGGVYLLASYSSSTLPVGTDFTAVGEHVPVQTIGTYFWFPYEVHGLIVDSSQPLVDSWFLR